MRLIFSFIFIISFLAQIDAQVQKTGTDFLATAKESQGVASTDEKINFLQNTDHTLPFVQELEFRTETHDFQLGEQSYAFRFKPNSPKQRRAQDSYHQSFIRSIEGKKRAFLLDKLEEKYKILVDHYFISGLIDNKEALKKLYLQKQKVLRAMVSSPDFNITNFVDTEADIFELESDIFELTQKQNTVNEYLNLAVGTTDLKTDFKDINFLIITAEDAEEPAFLANEDLQLRQDLIQKEYDKELAETNNLLEFVQAEFGGGNADIFRERFSIGAGIRLPFKGDKKLDLLELEYEKLEQNVDTKTSIAQKQDRIRAQVWRLRNLIDQHALLLQQSDNNQTQYALAQLKKTPDASPLQIIRMEEILLKKQSQIYRLEYRIYQEYVEWLHLTETTISLPLRNHLSKEQTTF